MKHFLLFIAAAISLNGIAANHEKEYRKITERYDVPVEVRDLENPTATVFWQTMLKNNDALRKFEKDMRKNRGAEKEALNELKSLSKFYPRYSMLVDRGMQPYCDSLMSEMGLPETPAKSAMYIILDPKPAAFNVATDDGFAICVTSGLLDRPGLNRDMLKGIAACGYAHGALQHELRNFYKAAKDKRRNRWIGAALVVGELGLAVTSDYLDYKYNNNPWGYTDNSVNIQNNTVIVNDAPEQTSGPTLYATIFTPDQIYEADMAAFRFMEEMGNADSYIEALKLMGADNDSAYAGYPDHPSTANRIALLEFIREHPEIRNTENIKIRLKGY